MVVESLAILLIIVPTLAPGAPGFGIGPIHSGIVVVFCLMVSILTPPIRMALYAVATVGTIPFHSLAITSWPGTSRLWSFSSKSSSSRHWRRSFRA